MIYNKTLLVVALTTTLGAASSAHAITFDSNGSAAGGVINGVSTFDWSPSGALAVGAVNQPAGSTFQLLSQGFLTNYLDASSNPILANLGLNSSYQVTFVTSFQEQIISTNQPAFPSTAVFQTTGSTAVPNFFEIYVNTNSATFASQLAGTGFNNGQLIATGTIQAGSFSNFSTVLNFDPNTGAPVGVPLDGFGTNNYPSINSVGPGIGGTIFNATVAFGSYDPNYFPNAIGPMQLAFNTSQALPFLQADPSLLFASAANVLGLGNPGPAPTQQGATIASVGTINGFNGPNIILQVDANMSPSVATVPEPVSLTLMGLSLLGLSFSRRRRSAVVIEA